MKFQRYGLALLTLGLIFASQSLALEEGEGRRRDTLTGKVSKVDASSLTLSQSGEGGERLSTFALQAATKFSMQTKDNDTVKGEGGRERIVPKTAPATAANLQVGQRVTVTSTEAGKAAEVLILREEAPRKGKEGDR